MLEGVEIRKLNENEAIPYHLLLLADPSREAIESYLSKSETYIAIYQKEIVGVYVLFPLDEQTAEIKNIAIDEKYQGKGLGKLLLANATHRAKEKGYQTLWIGTANSSIGQLYLYQKQGFELSEIKKNFFLENYPEPIYENGIQCKHLVMLRKDL